MVTLLHSSLRTHSIPLVVVAVLIGCAGDPAIQHASARPDLQVPTPVSELLPAGQVTLPSGRTFLVELARTPQEQARGYMGRAVVGPEEGMLFINEQPAVRRFWMKNCLVHLDLIWLDEQHRVVAMVNSAPPCRQDPCPSFGPAVVSRDVLELKGGVAAEEGLQVGDQLLVVIDGGRRR